MTYSSVLYALCSRFNTHTHSRKTCNTNGVDNECTAQDDDGGTPDYQASFRVRHLLLISRAIVGTSRAEV